MRMNHARLFLFLDLVLLCLWLIQPAHAQDGQLEQVDALNQEVVKLYQEGRYAEAIPMAEKALKILG